MGNIFSGSEIVELGVQIETNGRDFYDVLTKSTNNQRVKDLFEYLKSQEEEHIKAFQKLLKSVHEYKPPQAYPEEYFAYMNALASEHVFTQKDKGKEMARNIKSDMEAVDMGIGFEKDSIIFYEGMKKAVPEKDIEILDELIMQEQDHLRQLTELKKGRGYDE